MTEYLYDQSSLLITFVLLALMALALEAGYHLGRRPRAVTPEATLQQIDTVQSSLLGILALMLGFTFAIALERFNSRADAVRTEAGAIGTAWQRADLLPPSAQEESRQALRDYVSARAIAVSLAHPEQAAREAAEAEATALQARLWSLAVRASREAPHPATTGLYVQALDDVFGTYATTVDVTERHVPELVLLLLYASFIATGGVIGFSAALRGQRPSRAVYLMTGLIVIMMFVVMDLDRPRRGIIQVSPAPLLELRDSLRAAPATPSATSRTSA